MSRIKPIIFLFITIFLILMSKEVIWASGGDIIYTKPLKSVIFSHKAHSKIGCDRCHSGLFEMKALAVQDKPDFNMDSLYKGKYCGACHNGKEAFASDTQCARCHGGVKEYADFKKRPQQRSEIKGPQEPITIGKGDTKVDFKHSTHAKTACSDCHSRLFKMKKGSTKVTFNEHHNDVGCFTCHNGKQINNCASCHGKTPIPKGDIVYKIKGGVLPAYFNHEFHTQMFKCDDCHNKHFEMKVGGSKMNMQKMYEGKYCGVCHNGRIATDVMECAKCHYKK